MRILRLVLSLSLSLFGLGLLLALLGGWTATPIDPAMAAVVPGDLPAAARPLVSGVLGRDDPAYGFSAAGPAFHGVNERHRLSAELAAGGLQVRAGDHRWGLALQAWGYGDRLAPVAAAAPRAAANRVDYDRGSVGEWYVNGPLGLQQGFTLHQPPDGDAAGGPLTLALAQQGDLRAVVEGDRRGAVLRTPDGVEALRYAGLTVVDARGRDLPAWLEAAGDRLLVRLDDTGAVYPIVVDPWVQSARLNASDPGQNNYLGGDVAISGDGKTIVAGADWRDGGRGVAYVFEKPGAYWTDATQVAILTRTQAFAQDFFGISVAIDEDGSTIVVGAFRADVPTVDRGAAYVFERPGAHWTNSTQTAHLMPSSTISRTEFGSAVAVSPDGETVAVTARWVDVGAATDAGMLYVFARPGGGWCTPAPCTRSETARLTAADAGNSNKLGDSVAAGNDLIVVGAAEADFPGAVYNRGAAYLFRKPAGGWTHGASTAKLVAGDGVAEARFGAAVALNPSGDTVVAGAPRAASGVITWTGAVYVFEEPAGGWGPPPATYTQQAKLTVATPHTADQLGTAVAVDAAGDTVVGGAIETNFTRAISGPGAAYVYHRPAGGWQDATQAARLAAGDGEDDDRFGNATALSDDGRTVAIGSYLDDVITTVQGSVYVFRIAEVDLEISKSDGRTQAVPGQALTYTIVVTNRGLDAVNGAIVSDLMPAGLTGVTWQCTPFSFAACGAPTGTGHINTTVDLPPIGLGRVVFTASGVVSSGARGALVNTASVTVPVGYLESDAADNQAVDSDALAGGLYLPVVAR